MIHMDQYLKNIELSHTLKKMDDTTDTANREALTNLLPYFQLSHKSENKVINAIHNPNYHPLWTHEMNPHDRLFIPTNPHPSTDLAYIKYCNSLHRYAWDLDSVLFDMLEDYETWLKGKIEGQKLFKYILKNDIMPKDLVTEITTDRNAGQPFLVVSKNPIDWLFMSAGQSFHSCMSLESSYSDAYYMGMPELLVDHHKFLVFLTTGKLKSYEVHGETFKHFRYINRCISVFTNKKELGMIRYYPNKSLDYEKPLKSIGILSKDINRPEIKRRFFETDRYNNYLFTADQRHYISGKHDEAVKNQQWTSHSWPALPRVTFSNGEPCQPYNDCRRSYNLIEPGERYSSFGSSGSDMNIYWPHEFSRLDTDTNFFGNSHQCEECGDNVDADDSYWVNDARICERCADDHTFVCEICDERTWDSNHCTAIGEYGYDIHMCDDCYRDHTTNCDCCGQSITTHISKELEAETLCPECFEENSTNCEECGETISKDNAIGQVCEDCALDIKDQIRELRSELRETDNRKYQIEEEIEDLGILIGY